MSDEQENGPSATADITLRGRREAATVRDIPVSVMQVLYHEITGKSEHLSKSFNGNFFIQIEDLQQLFFKIDQTLEQFEQRGVSASISVRHDEGETQRYSSKEKFLQYDATIAKPITGITYNL